MGGSLGTGPFPVFTALPVKPTIDSTRFGSITIEGDGIEHDVCIGLKGMVEKRRKKLSKAVYGTSHTISEDEIRHIYEAGSDGIIIGSGQYGVARLSDEAAAFLQKRNCRVIMRPTPEALREWNNAEGKWIGLFHVTC